MIKTVVPAFPFDVDGKTLTRENVERTLVRYVFLQVVSEGVGLLVGGPKSPKDLEKCSLYQMPD